MTQTETRAKKPRSTGPRERRGADTKYIRDWLESLELEVKPTVHINGHAYTSALVTVDFGSPLKPVKLTPEQNGELTDRLRMLAKDIVGRENANIRISHDGQNGIFWASVG